MLYYQQKGKTMYILVKHEADCWPTLHGKSSDLDFLTERLVEDVKKEVLRNDCEFNSAEDWGDEYHIYRPREVKEANEEQHIENDSHYSLAHATFSDGETTIDWAIFDVDALEDDK